MMHFIQKQNLGRVMIKGPLSHMWTANDQVSLYICLVQLRVLHVCLQNRWIVQNVSMSNTVLIILRTHVQVDLGLALLSWHVGSLSRYCGLFIYWYS